MVSIFSQVYNMVARVRVEDYNWVKSKIIHMVFNQSLG
jgi:hypothetical protein